MYKRTACFMLWAASAFTAQAETFELGERCEHFLPKWQQAIAEQQRTGQPSPYAISFSEATAVERDRLIRDMPEFSHAAMRMTPQERHFSQAMIIENMSTYCTLLPSLKAADAYSAALISSAKVMIQIDQGMMSWDDLITAGEKLLDDIGQGE